MAVGTLGPWKGVMWSERARHVGSSVSKILGFAFLNPISPFFPHRTWQAAGERSKTVILVKNLPAGTSVAELEDVFGKHGSLGRVLLPEGGITAIVEFLEPTEAKQAFTKLAYSKVSVASGRQLFGECGSWLVVKLQKRVLASSVRGRGLLREVRYPRATAVTLYSLDLGRCLVHPRAAVAE